ncbi:MAG: DUF1800 domain-containing protein [Marmoricola sp.]
MGGRAWFLRQLDPASVPDPLGPAIDDWFPSLRLTPEQIFTRQRDEVMGGWEVMADLSRWTVARRIAGNRQVLEQMVDFWSNLLHVPLMADSSWFWRVDYDRVIRRLAFSSFEQLLQETTVHPAMGLYLSNAVSTKDAPNENLGRELLELHTVGVGAGYTEQDVKNSARLLTGYRADVWWPRFRAFYDPTVHWTGPVQVMGFHHDNAAADGRPAVAAYLSYLAHHPATARRIAHRLCVRFVSDQPSDGLVGAVADAYLRNGTAIRPTLLALVDHPEFAGSRGAKVRTPLEDYVATVRALGIRLQRPVDDDSFVNAMHWQYTDAGQAPYDWAAPDGFPLDNASWSSTGRMLTSFATHRELAAHWWPSHEVTYLPDSALLPPFPTTVDALIQHVGARVLGQVPDLNTRTAAATVVGRPLEHRYQRSSDLGYWDLIAVVTTLLDSPTHLYR